MRGVSFDFVDRKLGLGMISGGSSRPQWRRGLRWVPSVGADRHPAEPMDHMLVGKATLAIRQVRNNYVTIFCPTRALKSSNRHSRIIGHHHKGKVHTY